VHSPQLKQLIIEIEKKEKRKKRKRKRSQWLEQPPRNKPSLGTPPEIRPHLLTPTSPYRDAWKDYLPTLSILQSRLAFLCGQGQESEVPVQCHHSFGSRGRPSHPQCGNLAAHLPPPDGLPTPCPYDCPIICAPQTAGQTTPPHRLVCPTSPPKLPLSDLNTPPPLHGFGQVRCGKDPPDALR